MTQLALRLLTGREGAVISLQLLPCEGMPQPGPGSSCPVCSRDAAREEDGEGSVPSPNPGSYGVGGNSPHCVMMLIIPQTCKRALFDVIWFD